MRHDGFLWHRLRCWLLPCAALACVGTVIWATMGLVSTRASHSSSPGAAPVAAPRDRPVHVGFSVALTSPVGEAQVRAAVARLARAHPENLAELLHVLRVFGPDASIPMAGEPGGVKLLDLALDYERSRAYFRTGPTLIDTRDGVRCRKIETSDLNKRHEKEAHEDQLLAALAELGVPLSHVLTTSRGTRSVRRLMDDALAKFNLEQPEIEWSALAFALYLPPRVSWEDRFGTRTTFDDLAAEMMGRPLDETRACAGTHLVYSLTVMLRVDETTPLFTEPVRRQVRSYLEKMVAAAVRNQWPDGAWDLNWHADAPAMPKRNEGEGWTSVLATGHQVEWLAILPTDLLPPQPNLLRSLRWLHGQLRAASEAELTEHFCPYSHAGRVLSVTSRPSDNPPESIRDGGEDAGRVQSLAAPPPGSASKAGDRSLGSRGG
jgi:hypothetical protein